MQPRPGIATAACAAFVVLILAGCGSDDATISTVTETTTASTSTAAETTSTAEEEGPPPADVQADEPTGFISPTGNIGCFIDRRQVRCDISDRDWDPPSRPADCPSEVDYGQGIQLRAGAAPELVCAGDTVLGGGQELPYGQSIASGLLRCESEESGMSCRDVETGRGFTLSKESYELF